MTMAAFRLELLRSRAMTVWTALVTVAYSGIVAGFYPTFRDNQEQIDEYMALFPKELLAAFGMTGSLADPGTIYSTYIASMLWPIVAALVAIALATRPVAGDLERGFLELPLSTRLSRTRLLSVAIAVQAIALGVVAAAMIAAVVGVGRALGAPFDPGRFALAGLHAWAFGAAFAGPATLLGVVLLDRGRAAGIAAGVILGMYLLQVAASVWDGLTGLAAVSLFHHFDSIALIDDGVFPTADFALLVAVAAAGWILALFAFRRRDLAA